MLRPILAALALVTASLAGCQTAPALPQADTAITNVHILDPETGETARDRMILIEDGRIVAIAENDPAILAQATRRIDGAGRHAMPGLWDAHTHVLGDPSGEPGPIVERYLGHGITHLRDMGASISRFEAFKAWREDSTGPEPHFLLSERKVVSEALPWGNTEEWEVIATPEDAPGALARQKQAGVDFIKMYGPITPEIYAAVAEAADELDLPVSGHIPFQIGLEDVARAKPQTVEHFSYNLKDCGVDAQDYFSRGIAARFNNSGDNQHEIFVSYVDAIDWGKCRPQLEAIGKAGTAWTPTLGVAAGYGSHVDAAALESFAEDSLCAVERAAFTEDPGIEKAVIGALGRMMDEVRAAGIPILAGTDAEAFCMTHGQSLVWELRLLEATGLTRLEALQSATVTPAQVFGLEAEYGRIAPGRIADIVLLDASPLNDLSALSRPSGLYTDGTYLTGEALARMRDGT